MYKDNNTDNDISNSNKDKNIHDTIDAKDTNDNKNTRNVKIGVDVDVINDIKDVNVKRSKRNIKGNKEKEVKESKVDKDNKENKDHRTIGIKQILFTFHPYSPGAPFFLPHGTIIYNKLVNFLRKEYRVRGYKEVISPIMMNTTLFKISKHYEHYRDNMFLLDINSKCDSTNNDGKLSEVDNTNNADRLGEADNTNTDKQVDLEAQNEFALKPMSCPGHCLLFSQTLRSYRDLPIRYADFSSNHRNEVSGSLTGLTRVRKFEQDDAHIFCRYDQVESEILNAINFLKYVYKVFGFEFSIKLSTRPRNILVNPKYGMSVKEH